MADGAYRWLGNAPPVDPARVEAIEAAWADGPADAFGRAIYTAVTGTLERALAAARTDGSAEAPAQLAAARSALENLSPDALSPRKGLAGLFDSRGRRLGRFCAAYLDAVARTTASAEAVAGWLDAGRDRSDALDGAWAALRDGVAELDAHLLVAARRLAGPAPADGEPPDPLPRRRAALDACRTAALHALPWLRGVQGVDARSAEALKGCVEGLGRWRDDWKEGLGLSGRRPKRVRPDHERLLRSRDHALRRIDAALQELTDGDRRRAEIAGRLDDLRRSL